MITLKDVAQRANVAVSTVSYALNNDPRIPEETKNRVMQAAQELGYMGKSGRKHNHGYQRQLVLCLHSISGIIYPEIVSTLKSVLNVSNCELVIYVGENITNIKWMDGLFVLNSGVTTAAIKEVIQRRIPVVMMDRDETIEGAVNVTLDNFKGGYDVTMAVINNGARSFTFVGGPNTSVESKNRYDGFCQALADSRLQSKNTVVLQSDFTYEGGVSVCHFLLEKATLPDAIICANDETAMGIHDELVRKGLDDKVLLAGFDGLKPPNNFRYITAKAERKHWGAIAAYSMLQMYDHVTTEQKIKIPVEVVQYY